MAGSAQVLTHIQLGEAKRRYEAYFISKLSDCDGENSETDTWLDYARDGGYISTEQHSELTRESGSVGRMLGSILEVC